MRALTTTSSVLRVVCDTNADLDCHASSVDLTLSTGDVDEGVEEARLVQLAVGERVPIGDRIALLIDATISGVGAMQVKVRAG